VGFLIQVWHSLAFAMEPPLRLCCRSADPLPWTPCLGLAAGCAAAAFLVLWLTRKAAGDVERRALLLSFVMASSVNLFPLTVFLMTLMVRVVGDGLLFELLLAIFAAAYFVAGFHFLASGSGERLRTATRMANVFATTLLITTIALALFQRLTGAEGRALDAARRLSARNTRAAHHGSVRPDIYYVVLDGYGRADVLKDMYGVDSGGFLDYLQSRGFWIARGAQSNYQQTYLSLSSALNLTYLDELAAVAPPDRRPLRYMIEHAALVRVLKSLGYRFVLLPSGYSATHDAAFADDIVDTDAPSPFFYNGVALTPLWFFPPLRAFQYERHRETVLTTLDRLPSTAAGAGPKFVFAHVLSPHPPFVLGGSFPSSPYALNDGTQFFGSRREYVRGYARQVTTLDTLLQGMLDNLLARIDDRAIVILQGDHGPGSSLDWASFARTNHRERNGILAAYRVPPAIASQLYPTITPINAWRLILRTAFGADYPPQPDRSYYSTWQQPYQFRLTH
jgi:hypothetical protein